MEGDIQPWPWGTHPGRGHGGLSTRYPNLEGTCSLRKGGHIPWDRQSTLHRQGDPAPEGTYSPGYSPGSDQPLGHGESHPQRESPAPDVIRVPPSSPSRDMPTSRHFLKRHCWQRLRLMRTIEQFSFLRHFLYWMFCWMLRRKKPCGASGGITGGPRSVTGAPCPIPGPIPVPCSPHTRGRRSGSRRRHPRRPCRAAPSR